MRFRVRSARLQVAISAVAAGLFLAVPASSSAQTLPVSPPASCAVPWLSLANPSPGDRLLPGAYKIQGVALDPQSMNGSGIDSVSVFLGNRDQGGIELGSTAPGTGSLADGFGMTVTLPSTQIGEFPFTAYAHSSVTGKETQISLPVFIGEDPMKVGQTSVMETESNTNAGGLPTNCGTPPAAPLAPLSVPAPAVAPVTGVAPAEAAPLTGIAAAEAYAASIELQAPDPQSDNRDGEDAQQ